MLKPSPTIYLRDKFSIRPGLVGRYFEGQEHLVAALKEAGVSLVAACGEQPLYKGDPVPEVLPQMMHIWKVPQWDSLYNLMYMFSENDWYEREVSSLAIEHQDLLIKIGPGIALTERSAEWLDGNSGYVYLYDEVRLNEATTKMRHLRDLNWFQSIVEHEFDWRLTWLASEITGTPSQVCLLWAAPSIESIGKAFAYFSYAEDASVRERYANMMAGVRTLERRYMYPESTEMIDNKLPAPPPQPEWTTPAQARRRKLLGPEALASLCGGKLKAVRAANASGEQGAKVVR